MKPQFKVEKMIFNSEAEAIDYYNNIDNPGSSMKPNYYFLLIAGLGIIYILYECAQLHEQIKVLKQNKLT